LLALERLGLDEAAQELGVGPVLGGGLGREFAMMTQAVDQVEVFELVLKVQGVGHGL
jgi:hypothetical protein